MFFKEKRSIKSTGDNTVSNIGDNASIVVNQYSNEKKFNRSLLHEFCVRFASLPETPNEYDISLSSNIMKKIEYNEIKLYENIFRDCDFYIDDVEEILNFIPKRQNVIRKINYEYIRLRKNNDTADKDEICDLVHNSLLEVVSGDSELYIEEAEFAIHSLMYYAFTKCKLLDPVPMEVGG